MTINPHNVMPGRIDRNDYSDLFIRNTETGDL